MHNRRLPRLLMAAALGLTPILSAALSFAQVPPPVPALPDAERRTSYSISASLCSCAVNFALFGSGTDVDSWLEVWVAGTRYLSTDPSHGWALTSATGTLATIPRPITNAVLTFTAVQTGTIQIVGANRPRRLSQFQENAGVSARNLNQVITDIVAVQRETWDRTSDTAGRAILGLPGEIIAQMPAALARQGGFLCFDATGLIPQICQVASTGTATFPNSSTSGDIASFSGTTGKVLQDSGVSAAAVATLVTNNPGVDSNVLNTQIANYTIATTDCGKTIQAGTGSTGLFTVTLPSVSGFATNCKVTVTNGDTARAKTLAGVPNVSRLYPQQFVVVEIVNGAWAVDRSPGRWRVTSPTTLFVDNSLGSNSNDCLSAGAGGACLTFAAAFSRVLTDIDVATTVTVQAAAGQTYNNVVFSGSLFSGGALTIDGGSGTFTSSNGSAALQITSSNWTTNVNVQNVTITNTGSNDGLWCTRGFCNIQSGVTFGATARYRVHVDSGGFFNATLSPFTETGNAQAAYFAENSGSTVNVAGVTVTESGTPAYSTGYAYAWDGALIFLSGNTYSGSATGPKYLADLNGILNMNGLTLPGSTAGVQSRGGQVSDPGSPVVSACGTTPGAVSGKDTSGSVVEGTTATGCTITFSTANAPKACSIHTSSATVQAGLVISTLNATTLTVTHPSASSATLYWNCPPN